MSAIASMCESLQKSIDELSSINKALGKMEEYTQIFPRGDGTVEVFSGRAESSSKIKPLTASRELYDLHSQKSSARVTGPAPKDLMKYENKILKKVQEMKRQKELQASTRRTQRSQFADTQKNSSIA